MALARNEMAKINDTAALKMATTNKTTTENRKELGLILEREELRSEKYVTNSKAKRLIYWLKCDGFVFNGLPAHVLSLWFRD